MKNKLYKKIEFLEENGTYPTSCPYKEKRPGYVWVIRVGSGFCQQCKRHIGIERQKKPEKRYFVYCGETKEKPKDEITTDPIGQRIYKLKQEIDVLWEEYKKSIEEDKNICGSSTQDGFHS